MTKIQKITNKKSIFKALQKKNFNAFIRLKDIITV